MSIGEETQEEALPKEAIEEIDAVNEERETELLAQSPQDLVGDDSPSGAPPDESAGQPVEPPVAEVDEALAARAQFYGLDPTAFAR